MAPFATDAHPGIKLILEALGLAALDPLAVTLRFGRDNIVTARMALAVTDQQMTGVAELMKRFRMEPVEESEHDQAIAVLSDQARDTGALPCGAHSAHPAKDGHQ